MPIRDLDLLHQALVHRSWLHEHPGGAAGHNERLEFLGDAVVNLVISTALFARHPEDDEGSLSARRAAIVSTAGLAQLATRIDLGSVLYLGEGEELRGGRERPALLAASFEAVVGAIYIDLGWRRVRTWLTRLATPELALAQEVGTLKSPKSQLQEWTQRAAGSRPQYRLHEAIGPDHEKVFTIDVAVAGEVLGRGRGASRRVAETAAAAAAIQTLVERGIDLEASGGEAIAAEADVAEAVGAEADVADADVAEAAASRGDPLTPEPASEMGSPGRDGAGP